MPIFAVLFYQLFSHWQPFILFFYFFKSKIWGITQNWVMRNSIDKEKKRNPFNLWKCNELTMFASLCSLPSTLCSLLVRNTWKMKKTKTEVYDTWGCLMAVFCPTLFLWFKYNIYYFAPLAHIRKQILTFSWLFFEHMDSF